MRRAHACGEGCGDGWGDGWGSGWNHGGWGDIFDGIWGPPEQSFDVASLTEPADSDLMDVVPVSISDGMGSCCYSGCGIDHGGWFHKQPKDGYCGWSQDGAYWFDGLDPGVEYIVRVELPEDATQTYPEDPEFHAVTLKSGEKFQGRYGKAEPPNFGLHIDCCHGLPDCCDPDPCDPCQTIPDETEPDDTDTSPVVEEPASEEPVTETPPATEDDAPSVPVEDELPEVIDELPEPPEDTDMPVIPGGGDLLEEPEETIDAADGTGAEVTPITGEEEVVVADDGPIIVGEGLDELADPVASEDVDKTPDDMPYIPTEETVAAKVVDEVFAEIEPEETPVAEAMPVGAAVDETAAVDAVFAAESIVADGLLDAQEEDAAQVEAAALVDAPVLEKASSAVGNLKCPWLKGLGSGNDWGNGCLPDYSGLGRWLSSRWNHGGFGSWTPPWYQPHRTVIHGPLLNLLAVFHDGKYGR